MMWAIVPRMTGAGLWWGGAKFQETQPTEDDIVAVLNDRMGPTQSDCKVEIFRVESAQKYTASPRRSFQLSVDE